MLEDGRDGHGHQGQDGEHAGVEEQGELVHGDDPWLDNDAREPMTGSVAIGG